MRILTIFFILLFINCSDLQERNIVPAHRHSTAQLFLNNLRDSLKIEFAHTQSEQEKTALIEKYHIHLQDYLLANPLDSIRVLVEEISKNGWTVTTKFSDNDIEFKYGLTFKDSMPQRIDSIYKFMLGLERGKDTTISFSFTGACEINNPADTTVPIIRIFAFPVPLGLSQ